MKPHSQPRILVVEDDPAMQRMLRELLEWSGYLVDAASDGISAIELFHARAPSLVILDLVLPQMDGREVCRHLKITEPSLPIIILTATTNTKDKIDLFALGADDYFTKPFDPAKLLARVRARLFHARSARGAT